jgi:hypothetical protein
MTRDLDEKDSLTDDELAELDPLYQATVEQARAEIAAIRSLIPEMQACHDIEVMLIKKIRYALRRGVADNPDKMKKQFKLLQFLSRFMDLKRKLAATEKLNNPGGDHKPSDLYIPGLNTEAMGDDEKAMDRRRKIRTAQQALGKGAAKDGDG